MSVDQSEAGTSVCTVRCGSKRALVELIDLSILLNFASFSDVRVMTKIVNIRGYRR